MSTRIVTATNSNGTFSFDSNGYLYTNTQNIILNSKSVLNLISVDTSIACTDNLKLNTNSASISLYSTTSNTTTNTNSILIESKDDMLPLTLKSANGGQNIYSSGNININSNNGCINLGRLADDYDDDTDVNLTQNILLNALRKVSINTEDFYTIASDSINFISQSGEITFGSQIGESFIKFENNNVLINQQTSSSNRILDIHVNKNDSTSNSNGLQIISSDSTVDSDLKIINDKSHFIKLGITSSNSESSNISNTYNKNKKCVGYQEEDKIFLTTFIKNSDLNKKLWWEQENKTVLINGPISYITKSIYYNSNFEVALSLIDNTTTTTTTTNYNNCEQLQYTIEIENDATFNIYENINNEYKLVVDNYKISQNDMCLESLNLQIKFPILNGYKKGDFWNFAILQVVNTINNDNDKNDTYNITEQTCYILENENSYLSSSVESNLQFYTSESHTPIMVLSDEGGIGFNTVDTTPYSCNLSNNYNIENHIAYGVQDIYKLQNKSQNKSQKHIQNHNYVQLNNGGFVIVWEEKTNSYSHICYQRYLSNGEMHPNSKVLVVNQEKNCYCEMPYISNYISNENSNEKEVFIIVWNKKDVANIDNIDNVYHLYAQIFIDFKRKKGFDIPLGTTFNNKNMLSIKSIRLRSSGNFVIIWCGEDNNMGTCQFSIYGIIIDIGGNVVKDRFKISNNNIESCYYEPTIYNLDNDRCIVFYYETNLACDDEYENQKQYSIKYKVLDAQQQFNKKDVKYEEHYLLNTNNFVSYSFNLENNNYNLYIGSNETNMFDSNDSNQYFITSINYYKTCIIKINKIENNKIIISNVSNKDLQLLKANDIIVIKNVDTNECIRSEIDVIDTKTDTTYIMLSKSFVNIAVSKYILDPITNILKYETKNTSVNKTSIDSKAILKINNTLCGDLFMMWKSNNQLKYVLLNKELEHIIFEKEFESKYKQIKHFNCNDLMTRNKNASNIIVSYEYSNSNSNSENTTTIKKVSYKLLNIYNDLLKIHGNNKRNTISYKNDCFTVGATSQFKPYIDSNFHIEGSYSSKIIIVSTKYYVNDTDNTILCDTSDNDIELILDNNKSYFGRKYCIKNIKGDNKIIINSTTSIDGECIHIIDKKWGMLEIQSDGYEWFIISSNVIV